MVAHALRISTFHVQTCSNCDLSQATKGVHFSSCGLRSERMFCFGLSLSLKSMRSLGLADKSMMSLEILKSLHFTLPILQHVFVFCSVKGLFVHTVP